MEKGPRQLAISSKRGSEREKTGLGLRRGIPKVTNNTWRERAERVSE